MDMIFSSFFFTMGVVVAVEVGGFGDRIWDPMSQNGKFYANLEVNSNSNSKLSPVLKELQNSETGWMRRSFAMSDSE